MRSTATPGPRLAIDRLRLRLPAGFETRAPRIAELVAWELSRTPLSEVPRREHLLLPPLSIDPHASDRTVARQVAQALASATGTTLYRTP